MFWRVIEETGRRHGQLESWGQPPSPHAGRGADVGFLEAAARADRREGGGKIAIRATSSPFDERIVNFPCNVLKIHSSSLFVRYNTIFDCACQCAA